MRDEYSANDGPVLFRGKAACTVRSGRLIRIELNVEAVSPTPIGSSLSKETPVFRGDTSADPEELFGSDEFEWGPAE